MTEAKKSFQNSIPLIHRGIWEAARDILRNGLKMRGRNVTCCDNGFELNNFIDIKNDIFR